MLGAWARRRHAGAVVLLLLLPSPLPLRTAQLADGVSDRAGRVDLVDAAAGGLRFAADGSIVHVQSFYVDALCGDDHGDGRTAKTAFATMDAAIVAVDASAGKETTVFVRVGQAHRMALRDDGDPLADWPTRVIQPWRPEFDEKEKLDPRGCPFNENILVGISSSPGSTAVRARWCCLSRAVSHLPAKLQLLLGARRSGR